MAGEHSSRLWGQLGPAAWLRTIAMAVIAGSLSLGLVGCSAPLISGSSKDNKPGTVSTEAGVDITKLIDLGQVFAAQRGMVVWNFGARSYAAASSILQVSNPKLARTDSQDRWSIVSADSSLSLRIGRENDGQVSWIQLRIEDATLRYYPIALDERGHLYFSPQPIPSESIVSQDSGEILDPIALRFLGALSNPIPDQPTIFRKLTFTTCPSNAKCEVSYYPGKQLRAPFAGTVECVSPGTVELTGGGVRVRFVDAHIALGEAFDAARWTCGPPGLREPGNPIADNPGGEYYWLTAFDAAGNRIPLVVSDDYKLYTGPVYLRFRNPYP